MAEITENGELLESCLGIESFWEDVRKGYFENTNTREPQLSKEISILRKAMNIFHPSDKSRYIVISFLGVGGVGIVVKVYDKLLHTFRALKLARPIEGREFLTASLLSEEISRLQEVSHPNLICIFDLGTIESEAGTLNYYTMTFLRGALNARKFFSQKRTIDHLFSFLSGILNGTGYLHSISLVHLDLKPSNVYVGEDGFSVIGDLGGARKITGNKEDDLLVTCTSSYAHNDLLAMTSLSSSGEDNRRKGTIKRGKLQYEFDQYAVGKSIFEVLNLFNKYSPTELSQYQRKYLQLLSARLLDGRTAHNERPISLTEETLNKIKYKFIHEACLDLDKLLGRVNLLNEIPEISSSTDSVIQVTRGRKTRLTPRLSRLLQEPLLRRLSTVSQLGLVRLVYPGATHTRLEHSLGAYSNAVEYIRALYNDPINPLFKQIMGKDDLVATLLAALLHDLGQYQHAHDLYEVEPNIFNHESLTAYLLKGSWVDFEPLTKPFHKFLNDFWDIKPERVLAILEAEPTTQSSDIRDRILHTIISGPLDVDKLDYLLRDSDHCQAVFGNGLDRSRLLSTLTLVYQRGKNDEQYFILGIHEKGRAAAESLGFIRFQMFRSIYWHHTVRSAKSMLQRAVYEWIAKDGFNPGKNDTYKHELHNFILQTSKTEKNLPGNQPLLFGQQVDPLKSGIGYTLRPQWSSLGHTDMLALNWFHKLTNDTGKFLIESLSKRELYKRVFVISAVQDQILWEQIQKKITNYTQVKERSEELRKALKLRIDQNLEESSINSKHFFVTGIGDETNSVINAARILGKEGTVLIDIPTPRGKELLNFFPEDLHRGQKEEFESPSILVVSELWKLVSDKLHEMAGNIRIFVHPMIDVLRSAKTDNGNRLLDSQIIEEEINKMFKVKK